LDAVNGQGNHHSRVRKPAGKVIEFARRPPAERSEVFEETAARRGIGRAVIVEKDFWVTWVLAQLYAADGLSPTANDDPVLLFKGGTSLSKAYGLIDRFSEDIDLTVDHGVLIEIDDDPDEPDISKNERKRRIEKTAKACAAYVADSVAPFLNARLADMGAAEVRIDEEDPQTVRVIYPYALSSAVYGQTGYVNSELRLEFGARGAMWPSERREVTSFAAVEFPDLFTQPATPVFVLSPQRTFWEKATILHAIASSGRLPNSERQSRHYADLVRIGATEAGRDAIADTELLIEVADHKAAYFPAASARYDLARPGTLRLSPPNELEQTLERDYARMREMFMAEPPTFREVMAAIRDLENRINIG
jgi:hypothetical protein